MSKRNFIVIGLGRFGRAVAKSLCENNMGVAVVDKDESKIKAASESLDCLALSLDITDEVAISDLKKNIHAKTNIGIVATGDLGASLMAVTVLQDIEVSEIIAKAVSKSHANILSRMGVTRVVFPEQEMGERVAESILFPGVREVLKIGMDMAQSGLAFHKIEVTKERGWADKFLKEVGDFKKHDIVVFSVFREAPSNGDKKGEDEKTILRYSIPDGEYKIQLGDLLWIVGKNEDIKKLEGKRKQ